VRDLLRMPARPPLLNRTLARLPSADRHGPTPRHQVMVAARRPDGLDDPTLTLPYRDWPEPPLRRHHPFIVLGEGGDMRSGELPPRRSALASWSAREGRPKRWRRPHLRRSREVNGATPRRGSAAPCRRRAAGGSAGSGRPACAMTAIARSIRRLILCGYNRSTLGPVRQECSEACASSTFPRTT
jgi:hypothetical protein